MDHGFGNQVPGLESTEESNEGQISDSSTEDEIWLDKFVKKNNWF